MPGKDSELPARGTVVGTDVVAVKLLCRAVIRLARLQLRQLDADDGSPPPQGFAALRVDDDEPTVASRSGATRGLLLRSSAWAAVHLGLGAGVTDAADINLAYAVPIAAVLGAVHLGIERSTD